MNEHVEPSVSSVALRYGIITGLVLVIFTLILLLTDMSGEPSISWLAYLIIIGGIVLGMKHFRAENGGFMSYGQGLGLGTLLSVIAGGLAGITTYVYIKFIDSSSVGKILEKQRLDLEERGMDDDQIEQTMAMTEKFTNPEMMLVFTILIYLMVGFILSLIIAAIMKRNRPEFV
ncbi:MAG: DUF4199 domain-containing protein [Hymenobacteraceae bacterium]|nr:DUF4199 domain-containing protein [Hymenobacteraceae bacterium]MDX5395577.1 DUF4199 domain-containing protein [Hymenobacteraceae bacterium]MDX5443284.1 DUF4199 domain-containing protein [Hymenobacteraceae bacterium]MDX5511629.1 DUF4199 domain-containing protein [Hymenobacteraceae bacterium]